MSHRCDLCREDWPPDQFVTIHLRQVCPRCAPSYRRQLRVLKYAVLGFLTLAGVGAAWLGRQAGATDPGMRHIGYGISLTFLGVVLVHLLLEAHRKRRAPPGTRLEP